MKKFVTALCTVATLCAIATSAFAANQVRISQVYGGGGGGGAATYQQDYVELFNFGGTPVNIGGWAVEYGSTTGNWGSSAANMLVFPVGTTIQPCSYLLVALGTVGAGGAAFPVTPDFSNTTTNMAAGAGKVGLFNAVNSNLACGSELVGTLVDKVGYGTGSNCPEVAVTPTTSITSGVVRNIGGNQDTDNNAADFTLVTNPVPRNSASPRNPVCVDSFGACCLRNTTTGACAMVSSSQACTLLNGIFLGLGTSCFPTPCATPTEKHTWGQVKSIYR